MSPSVSPSPSVGYLEIVELDSRISPTRMDSTVGVTVILDSKKPSLIINLDSRVNIEQV
jgi:hypothetical protein